MLWLGLCIFGYAVISVLSSFIFGNFEKEYMIVYAVVAVIGIVLMIIGALRGKGGKSSKHRSTFECTYENLNEFKKNAESILTNDGYRKVNKKGESVWEKSISATPTAKYIKIEYSTNKATISGWLGGFGDEELNLNGFIGIVHKIPVKMTINKIMKGN